MKLETTQWSRRAYVSLIILLTSCATPSLPLSPLTIGTTRLLEKAANPLDVLSDTGNFPYETLEATHDSIFLTSLRWITQRMLNQAGTKYISTDTPWPTPNINTRYVGFPQPLANVNGRDAEILPSQAVSTPSKPLEPASYAWLVSTGEPNEIYVTSYRSSIEFKANIYRLFQTNSSKRDTKYDPDDKYFPYVEENSSPVPSLYPKAFTFEQNDFPYQPQGLTYLPGQGWYMTSMLDHRIFRSQGSQFSAWVGNKESGYIDGTANQARFEYPRALDVDRKGNAYVIEADRHRIRKITPDGTVSTLAGSTEAGFKDGKGSEARFNKPFDLAVNAKGEVFISDTGNHRIRKITPDGTVSTVIGTGEPGVSEGELSQAKTGSPMGIDFGPDGTFYYIAEGSVFTARLD